MATPTPVHRIPELLAPAGDSECLRAALDAGADAVYFGLERFNARRRAGNFRTAELTQIVKTIHAENALAYLTLNTDLDQRELPAARELLERARDAEADAVIIRDLGLLAIRPQFPELAFHLSTQAAVTCGADVAAARDMGVNRVVLARELSLAEITAASSVPHVETEVFVQGALCFCVSGRCHLSSWISGRSANRGLCASPCRLPWRTDDQPANPTPFSMLDLVTIDRLGELARAGVAALKIEGRLKTAEWVRTATRLYRRALDHPKEACGLRTEADALSRNTGRQTTSAYLDARRSALTGLSSRQAISRRTAAAGEYEFHDGPADFTAYELEITVADAQVQCRVIFGGRTTRFRLPAGSARGHQSQPLAKVIDDLSKQLMQGARLKHVACHAPDVLFTASQTARLRHGIRSAIERTPRPDLGEYARQGEEALAVADSAQMTRHAAQLPLGHAPDRIRLDAGQALDWRGPFPTGGMIIEGVTHATLEQLIATQPPDRVVLALPAVFFEGDLATILRLIETCAGVGTAIEANNLAGLRLALEIAPNCTIEAGPGLAVLNASAAEFLFDLGARCVAASLEADRGQLQELASCAVPLSVTVFGRPPLLVTRAEPPEFRAGQVYQNDRGLGLICRRESGLWVFRPEAPFDLRRHSNSAIRATHLVADLIASRDPLQEWRQANATAHLFNYSRKLA